MVEVEALSGDSPFNIGLTFVNEDDVMLFTTHDIVDTEWHGKIRPKGRFRSVCTVPANLLAPGTHRVTVQAKTLHSPSRLHFREFEALAFDVQDAAAVRGDVMRPLVGVVRPLLAWTNEYRPES